MPYKDPQAKRDYMKRYRESKPEVLRNWREKNREKFENYCKEYRAARAEHYRQLKQSPKYKEWSKNYSANYYKSNREKAMARVMVNEAKRSGKITAMPCEVCGELKVQAHHDDYSKPLEVRWLCTKHHAEHHKNERKKEKANAIAKAIGAHTESGEQVYKRTG